MNSTHDELEVQGRRSGRRAGRPDTRGEIAAAAGRLFAERGYDRTSMRAIAAEAGVDPALVTHYFGSKQRLFVATVQLPIDPALVTALAAGGNAENAGERLARAVIGVLESPPGRERATSIVRAAASEPEAAALLRQQLSEQLFGPVARELGGQEPELRANLCGSQMVGLVMARYVVAVEPLASTDPERVIRAIAPVLQHYLTGDLDAAF
jgi:AcrR family transcriptional regulator